MHSEKNRFSYTNCFCRFTAPSQYLPRFFFLVFFLEVFSLCCCCCGCGEINELIFDGCAAGSGRCVCTFMHSRCSGIWGRWRWVPVFWNPCAAVRFIPEWAFIFLVLPWMIIQVSKSKNTRDMLNWCSTPECWRASVGTARLMRHTSQLVFQLLLYFLVVGWCQRWLPLIFKEQVGHIFTSNITFFFFCFIFFLGCRRYVCENTKTTVTDEKQNCLVKIF